MQYSKKDDLVGTNYHEVGSDLEKFLGHWENTNPNTGHIISIDFMEEEGQYYMRAFGASDDAPIDFGKAPCELFSSKVNTSVIQGMTAYYDLGFIKIDVAANLKYGVLVIQTYNTFTDGSKRNNYFGREFFHQRIQK